MPPSSYIRADGDGIAIGATTRQCVAERDALIAAKLPLLTQAIPFVGHAATRARGTVGGSLAHADPAAELPLIAVTLDATLRYRAGGKDAEMAARDFFTGLMITALPAGACLTGVRFPVWRGKVGVGFHEVNARRSDFAFVAAAAQVELGDDGNCKRIAIGIGAATDFPLRLDGAEKQLIGTSLDEARSKTPCAPRSPTSNRSTTCMPRPNTAAAPRSVSPCAPSPTPRPMRWGGKLMRIELSVNGAEHELDVEPRTTLLDCLRDAARPQGRPCRLRARRLRRLHRAVRRRRGALLPDVRGRRRKARRSRPSKASRPVPANCR